MLLDNAKSEIEQYLMAFIRNPGSWEASMFELAVFLERRHHG
jgi:hypothetical protein